MVDPEIAAALQPYLSSGERLTWTGRPATGLMLRAQDIFLIPFSLLWCGFVVFWMGGALMATRGGNGETAFLPLFGLPHVLIGVYLLVGRFAVDAWLRGGTLYGLTDRRAVVLRKTFGSRLLTAPLDGQVQLSRQRGERGSLTFGTPNPFRAFSGGGLWAPGMGNGVTFDGVPDVMAAYGLATPPRP